MNIIDAWKEAKEWQSIFWSATHTRGISWRLKKESGLELSTLIRQLRIEDDALLGDNWEVVKEKKTKTCTLYDIVHRAIYTIPGIPASAKVTIEWEE